MKTETTDLTKVLNADEELFLVNKIGADYDKYETARTSQLSDIKLVRSSIYNTSLPGTSGWDSKIELPDIYELAQTLKSHISENLYGQPEAMFDVAGTTPQSQAFANRQKAMLVNTLEQMNIQDEVEKIIDSIVETGECTMFVGWETKMKSVRRAQTFEEQLLSEAPGEGFIVEEKIVYDNARVRHVKAEDFVFDTLNVDNWDKCAKIYRTYASIDELQNDDSNNLLTQEKIENLKGVVASKKKSNGVKENKLEVIEFWGDIELADGRILKNWLLTIAGRREIIRSEANPFVINPFIHANIIESPDTRRGIPPLRVALIMNNISSTILNKQLDALALMMNPPYLAPKGAFKGEQAVHPGKIIEYDAALMPQAPAPLAFDKAMVGWDFLNYFKQNIESSTGIFKNMSGLLAAGARTATELNYSVSGQEARLSMILDAINRKVIVPMVEKVAEIIANFKLGKEVIGINERGRTMFMEIDDNIRNARYIYNYGDRKATFQRKMKLKELFEVVKSFAQVPEVAMQINWLECFKFALEQYGIENAQNFLKDEQMPMPMQGQPQQPMPQQILQQMQQQIQPQMPEM